MTEKKKDSADAPIAEETEHTGESPRPGHRDAGQVQADALNEAQARTEAEREAERKEG